jgi:hypothetical protein
VESRIDCVGIEFIGERAGIGRTTAYERSICDDSNRIMASESQRMKNNEHATGLGPWDFDR